MEANTRFGICTFVAQRDGKKISKFPPPTGARVLEEKYLRYLVCRKCWHDCINLIKKKKKKREKIQQHQETKIPSNSYSVVWWSPLHSCFKKYIAVLLASLKSSFHHGISACLYKNIRSPDNHGKWRVVELWRPAFVAFSLIKDNFC